MNLIYQQINKYKYSVRTNNGKLVGDLIIDMDGHRIDKVLVGISDQLKDEMED